MAKKPEIKDTQQVKGYNGNQLIKRIDQKIDWTPEMIKEYVKCKKNPIYFTEKYMKIININEGLVPFTLYPYQKRMLKAFADNRFNIVTTARQAGKALPLDTDIPTPNGWRKMKDLSVGDEVFSDEGIPIKVTNISEIFTDHDCYRMWFDDETFVDADAEHIWSVLNEKKEINKTTSELFKEITYLQNSYSVKLSKPVNYTFKNVQNPYTFGVWVNSHLSSDEKKYIPKDYLMNSIENKISLLQGLMDANGWTEEDGINCISLSSEKCAALINDIYELLTSLGLKVFRKKYNENNTESLYFHCNNFNVFRLSHKLKKQKEFNKNSLEINSRFITKIEKIKSVPTKCIVVDSENHLFLCTKNYIPTHNSTVTCAFILWYVLFNESKTVALLANKGDTAREILHKIQLAYQHLPKWLQQGVGEWQKGNFELENNSRVIATATSSDAIRGYSINVLFIDEAAFIENWDAFFTSVYPTISSGKNSKIILVSTPNGLNHFHKIWSQSDYKNDDPPEKQNGYHGIRVTWKDVPGRDEDWKQKTLGGMSFDLEKFSQEHECEFLGSSGTLISGWKLKELIPSRPMVEKDGLTMFIKPEPNKIYSMICDVSRGKGLDYSAFQVIDATQMPYQQVAVFRNNSLTPYDFSEIIHRTAIAYNNASVLVEINDIGEQVSHSLHYDLGYDNVLFTENAGRNGKRITQGFGGGGVDKGIRTTKMVKSVGCSILKLLIEGNALLLNDYNTIHELSTFSKKANSYEAEQGNHDDLVMCLVLFAWLSEQQFFKDMTNINTLMALREKTNEELEQDMLPFGFVDNGRNSFIDESYERFVPESWMWNQENF